MQLVSNGRVQDLESHLAEFANTGPGAGYPATRANLSSQLSSPITMQTVLGNTKASCIDAAFL